MKLYVAVNEDYDIWAAASMKKLLARLEDDCGGWYRECTPTHWVKVRGTASKETTGWVARWDDRVGDEYDIYISKVEVVE